MSYIGKDRRIHAVVSTLNREYHICSGICIAVRDKKSGVWMSNHEAIGMTLEEEDPLSQHIGGSVHFVSSVSRIQTTRVENVFRPNRSIVDFYALVWSFCPHINKLETDQLFSYR